MRSAPRSPVLRKPPGIVRYDRGMKLPVYVLSALLVAPVAAFAQVPPGSPAPQTGAAMDEFRTQVDDARKQMRASVIGALTPAHRTAIANIIGSLALSPTPDVQAAETSIDALLGDAEKSAIVASANAERSAMQQLRGQDHAGQPAGVATRPANATPDVGRIVLHTLASFGRSGGPGRLPPGR